MVIVEAGEGRGRASRGGSAGSKGKQRSVAIFTGVSHSHKSLNSRIRALGTGNYKTITDNWAEYIHERATGSTGRQRSCFPPKGPLKQEPLVDVTIWGCRCWDWFVPGIDITCVNRMYSNDITNTLHWELRRAVSASEMYYIDIKIVWHWHHLNHLNGVMSRFYINTYFTQIHWI